MAAATASVCGSKRSRFGGVSWFGLAFMPPSSIPQGRSVRNGLHHMCVCSIGMTGMRFLVGDPVEESLHQIGEDQASTAVQVDAVAVKGPAIQARYLIGRLVQG